MKTMKIKQQDFLADVKVFDECGALKNTIKASFGRNKIYESKPTLAERKELQEKLKIELEKLSARYGSVVKEDDHCNNIEQIADTISRQFGGILKDGRFRIGTAQKALITGSVKYFTLKHSGHVFPENSV